MYNRLAEHFPECRLKLSENQIEKKVDHCAKRNKLYNT